MLSIWYNNAKLTAYHHLVTSGGDQFDQLTKKLDFIYTSMSNATSNAYSFAAFVAIIGSTVGYYGVHI